MQCQNCYTENQKSNLHCSSCGIPIYDVSANGSVFIPYREGEPALTIVEIDMPESVSFEEPKTHKRDAIFEAWGF